MKTLTKLILGLLIVVLGALGVAYSGMYNVSALSGHSGVADWLLSTISRHSVERRAEDISVPELSDRTLVLAGANDFQTMCVSCHGAPGIEAEAVGKGLNPPPPDLSESARHMTPAQLFWVTQNGIRMTGMPAWGATHDENDIWPVVAFVAALPGIDANAYQSMLKQAQGTGHHAADGAHPHGDHTEEHDTKDADEAMDHAEDQSEDHSETHQHSAKREHGSEAEGKSDHDHQH